MASRDFILREIQRLGATLAALRKRLLGGGEDRSDVIAIRSDLDSFGQRVGLDPTLLRSVTADTLALMMRERATVDPANCWLWAEFLYLDGLTAQAEDNDAAAQDRFTKALMLYHLLGANATGAWLTDVPERIAEIEQYLGG